MGMMASFMSAGEFMDREKLIAYIRKRRNPDGGYVFARGLPSTPQDTFYALSCLRRLGVTPQEPMRSMEYARAVLDETPTLFKTYYALGSLLALEQPIEEYARVVRRVVDVEGFLRGAGSGNADVGYGGFSSPLCTLLMMLVLCKWFEIRGHEEDVASRVLDMRCEDGGFGAGTSDIRTTYLATACLRLVGVDIRDQKLERFVRSCEHPEGGFSATPNTRMVYIEDIYAGCMLERMLGCTPRASNMRAISRFQNSDGGFRRSPYAGISSLQCCHLATSVLTHEREPPRTEVV